MEQKFIAAWAAAREEAAKLGVRMRPIADGDAMKTARRTLSGNRESDGFAALESAKRLDLSLEALVVDKRFTGLFSDEEANTALMRLLDAGFYKSENRRPSGRREFCAFNYSRVETCLMVRTI